MGGRTADLRGGALCVAVTAMAAVLAACSQPAPQATAQSAQPAQAPAAPQLVVAGAPVAIRGDAVSTEVPLEEDGGTYVVPVSINDTISLKFTIDSGAADVNLPSDVVTTLIRSGTITKDDYIGDKTFVLADGTRVPSAEFRIRSLKIGTLVLHDVVGSVGDPRGSLLLGQSFLSRLSTWSFDNGRHSLLLKAAPGEAEHASGPPAPVAVSAPLNTEGQSASTASAAADEGPTARAVEFLRAWSNPQDPDGVGIRAYYAPVVRYYGKPSTVDEVMLEKVKFAKRWPARTYVARPGTIVVTCTDERTCSVTGVLDWQAENLAYGRRSTGVAAFGMVLRDGLIASETGTVMSRDHSGTGG